MVVALLRRRRAALVALRGVVGAAVRRSGAVVAHGRGVRRRVRHVVLAEESLQQPRQHQDCSQNNAQLAKAGISKDPVSYTHLRAHET